MSILALPHELLTLITKELDARDLNALLQSHSFLYHSLNDYLYSWNVEQDGNTALLWAAKHGSEVTIQRFLNIGVDVRWKSRYWSCTRHYPRARHLRHTKHDAESSFQEHPISYAAANGHTGIVVKLLDHGADINFKDLQGRGPLALAALAGHFETVRTLVARGANLLSIDAKGCRPIGHAAFNGHHAIEDYLLEHLCQKRPCMPLTIKVETHFMLLYAAQRGDEERVKFLLFERGADIDSQLPVESHTPLCAAIAHAPLSMIKLLLDNGASPNVSFSKRKAMARAAQRPSSLAPLQLAIKRDESYEIIQLLVQHGMRMNVHICIFDSVIRLNKPDEFRLLLDAGADIESDPRLLKLLYIEATRVQCQPIIDMLVGMGADSIDIALRPGRNRGNRLVSGVKQDVQSSELNNK
jgi:ankyrin repeat protein